MIGMVDIQTERVLMAVMDALFDDVDTCPKKEQAVEIMEAIRQDNNREILDQIGSIKTVPCDPKCPRRPQPR